MNKFLLFLILIVFSFTIVLPALAIVHVNGYFRSNGTYVSPHYRSDPDGIPTNNWSYPGNTNPITGKTATGNPETYLENHYNQPTAINSSTSSLSTLTSDNEVNILLLKIQILKLQIQLAQLRGF